MSEIGQQLIDAVRKHAEERPNYITQTSPRTSGCAYVDGGRPSCLIGQALWDLGLISASFEEAGPCVGRSARANHDVTDYVIPHLGLDLDNDELAWLGTVQAHQDRHNPWGIAVAMADTEI